jgi:hypothetical protein
MPTIYAFQRYRTSKSSALEAGARPAARRVELNYAAAAALAAESHLEKREAVASDLHDALEIVRRDDARLEADEKAAAREWTRRLIESGSGTSRDDDDEFDIDPHQWGGDSEIIDDKVVFISAFYASYLIFSCVCRVKLFLAKAVQMMFYCD